MPDISDLILEGQEKTAEEAPKVDEYIKIAEMLEAASVEDTLVEDYLKVAILQEVVGVNKHDD